MAFNIDQFRTNGLKEGGARPSLFDVEIIFPSSISSLVDNDTIRNMRFLCRATQIPGFNVSPIEVPYFGRKIKVAGDRTFSDWSVTVMNDENFKVRAAFEAWSNHLNSVRTNVTTGKPKDIEGYKATAIVRQYSKRGKSPASASDSVPLRSYQFVGIFPTTIDAIALDWDSTNQIETFDVTFSYDYWDVLDNNTGAVDVAATSRLPGDFSPS
jgi:hypothetical protein